MPQLDGTGPRSKGPLTGKALRYRQLQSMKDSKKNIQEIKAQLESELKLVNQKIENTDK